MAFRASHITDLKNGHISPLFCWQKTVPLFFVLISDRYIHTDDSRITPLLLSLPNPRNQPTAHTSSSLALQIVERFAIFIGFTNHRSDCRTHLRNTGINKQRGHALIDVGNLFVDSDPLN